MATNVFNFGPELDAIFADAQQDVKNQGAAATMQQKILAAVAGIAAAQDAQTGLIKADVQLLSDKFDSLSKTIADLIAALGGGDQPLIDQTAADIKALAAQLRDAVDRDKPKE